MTTRPLTGRELERYAMRTEEPDRQPRAMTADAPTHARLGEEIERALLPTNSKGLVPVYLRAVEWRVVLAALRQPASVGAVGAEKIARLLDTAEALSTGNTKLAAWQLEAIGTLKRVARLREHIAAVERALAAAAKGCALTCTSGDGLPYVSVQFERLEDAQAFNTSLAAAISSRTNPRSEDTQEAGHEG